MANIYNTFIPLMSHLIADLPLGYENNFVIGVFMSAAVISQIKRYAWNWMPTVHWQEGDF